MQRGELLLYGDIERHSTLSDVLAFAMKDGVDRTLSFMQHSNSTSFMDCNVAIVYPQLFEFTPLIPELEW